MKVKRIICLIVVSLTVAVFSAVNIVAASMSDVITEWLCGYSTGAEEDPILRREGAALAEQIQAEGTVMVKNDGILPLKKAETPKINVFGWSATQWIYGGSGSGQVTGTTTDFLSALTDYGVEYNAELINAYENFQNSRPYNDALHSFNYEFCRLYEPSIYDTSVFSADMLQNAKTYSDAAVVIIGRVSGESNDAPKVQYKLNKKGGGIITDETRTYLEISAEEEELLTYVGANFGKVVVLVNSVSVMELSFTDTVAGIDACLIVGGTANYGANAIPKLLYGDITPSGKTVDTYAYSLEDAPSYADTGSGNDTTNFYTDGSGLYPTTVKHTNGSKNVDYNGVAYTDYRDGIYVGYKWFETADAENYWQDRGGYDKVVQYPFGFGLSYTEFDWEVISTIPQPNTALSGSDEIEITVRVTNVGMLQGQDVVQVYYTPPYTKGGIEKSAVNLVAFGKTTKVLQPGESQILKLKFKVEDMRSYDCYDKNNDGHRGYELEKGVYEITLRTDAHTVKDTQKAAFKYRVDSDIRYDTDSASGNPVKNLFTGNNVTDGVAIDGNSDGSADITYLSRADFKATFPREHAENRAMTDKIRSLNLYTSEMANAAINSDDLPVTTGSSTGLKVFENDAITDVGLILGSDHDSAVWDIVLDQMTISEMENVVLHGYVHTRAIPSVGKPETRDLDGPNQIGSFNVNFKGVTGFNSVVAAQTWNVELIYGMALTIGKEAAAHGVNGWYGPGVNVHRSPFCGRNYEYYSEDAFMSGIFAANAVKAAKNAGVYGYLKHLALYEQESGRDGMYTFTTEQALRETYVRPFEIAVKEGGATAIMTSYGRIGAVWTGGSYALLTELVRNEWGFKGAFLTDYADHRDFMNADQMLRAGGDIWMDGYDNKGTFRYETTSDTFKKNLRRAAKDVTYTWLNALAVNASYNAEEDNVPIITAVPKLNFPWWIPVMIGVDVTVAAACALWVISAFKKPKQKTE